MPKMRPSETTRYCAGHHAGPSILRALPAIQPLVWVFYIDFFPTIARPPWRHVGARGRTRENRPKKAHFGSRARPQGPVGPKPRQNTHDVPGVRGQDKIWQVLKSAPCRPGFSPVKRPCARNGAGHPGRGARDPTARGPTGQRANEGANLCAPTAPGDSGSNASGISPGRRMAARTRPKRGLSACRGRARGGYLGPRTTGAHAHLYAENTPRQNRAPNL